MNLNFDYLYNGKIVKFSSTPLGKWTKKFNKKWDVWYKKLISSGQEKYPK